MKNQQSGFTLIELVAVIVILGALAVVAIPRFVDLQDDAQEAATQGVAGGLASAAATNYAAFIADNNTLNGDNGAQSITSCSLSDFNSAMQTAINTNDYSLDASGTSVSPDPGESFDCTLTNENSGDTVSFSAIATS